MGIGITSEHRELAEAVRGWVARTVPPEEVRKLLDSPPRTGVRPPWWDALVAQGLLAPHLEGGTLLDLAVVVEEAAQAALPGRTWPVRSPPPSSRTPAPANWRRRSPTAAGSEPWPWGPAA